MGHRLGQLLKGYRMFGAHIVGAARDALEEEGPKPDGEIGRVKVGAHRSSVTRDDDMPSGKAVPNEVPNGKF